MKIRCLNLNKHISLQYKSRIGTNIYLSEIIESFPNLRDGITKYILIYYKRGIKRYTNQNRSKNKLLHEQNIILYILYSTVFYKISSSIAWNGHRHVVDHGRCWMQHQIVVVVMVLVVVLVVIGCGRRRGCGCRDHEIEVTSGVVQRGVTRWRGAGCGRTALGGRGR